MKSIGLLRHSRSFSSTTKQRADFTHAVVGGGAVGLAIARKLQQRDGASTVLIEKHGAVGTETSSRNSEVIHASLYYGTSTLKAHLCVKGKALLYALCEKHSIPFARVGKLIVAQDEIQTKALESLHSTARSLEVPTSFLSEAQVSDLESSVRAKAGALFSPSTGILDSHTYMAFLHGSFTEAGGDTALASTVTSISPPSGTGDWTLTVRTGGEESTFTTETIINSAGLGAIPLANSILPEPRRLKPFYAKGTYYSYSSREPRTKHLLYPAPVPGHGGLGTHLTMDLNGRIRFGPDVEWVSDPGDLAPSSDMNKMQAAIRDIKTYLPSIDESKMEIDYCGIRPKLAGKADGGGKDFYIKLEDGYPGFVNLLGIESPGLTSSLAIADMVEELLYR